MRTLESWASYAVDADEALATIETALLTLEGGHNAEMVNRLYRGLHTIKGNSGFLQLGTIERVSHVAESAIGMVRDEGRVLDPELLAVMFSLLDCLRRLIAAAAAAHSDVTDPEVEPLLARTSALIGGVVAGPDRSLEGLHLFEDEEDGTDGVDAGASADDPFGDSGDDGGFFLALARSLWTTIASGGDGAGRALLDLERAAERTGHTRIGLAVEACLASDTGEAALITLARALVDMGLEEARAVGERSLHLTSARGLASPDAPADAALVEGPASPTTTNAAARPTATPKATPTTAPPPPPTSAAATASKAPVEQTLKIDGGKVTSLMALAGELGIAVHAVTRHPGIDVERLVDFQARAHRLEALITELQTETASLRLVPVADVFGRMRRVARDASLRTGKEVDFVTIGADTEIDKAIVDRLPDALMHVVRNAIDHGLENGDERLRRGKPLRGRVVLQAAHRGGSVEIVVADDGAGVDLARVRARAVERGLCAPHAVTSDDDIINFLFSPGFSTAAQVTELSGRGVGLDVLRSTIESMHGTVRLRSVWGSGCRLEITLPLTVAFMEAMVVRVHQWLLAIPIDRIHQVQRVAADRVIVDAASGASLVRFDDGLVPMVRLESFFAGGLNDSTTSWSNHEDSGDRGHRSGDQIMVVAHAKRGRLAFPVASVVGNQQVMLKPLNGVLQHLRAAAGYGVLRSGDVALTLDCEQLNAA